MYSSPSNENYSKIQRKYRRHGKIYSMELLKSIASQSMSKTTRRGYLSTFTFFGIRDRTIPRIYFHSRKFDHLIFHSHFLKQISYNKTTTLPSNFIYYRHFHFLNSQNRAISVTLHRTLQIKYLILLSRESDGNRKVRDKITLVTGHSSPKTS